MSDSLAAERQRTATQVWELRTEHQRATEERDRAEQRRDEVAKRLREAEKGLAGAVGANLHTKMWIVRTGTVVIARYRNEAVTIDVLEAEPQE